MRCYRLPALAHDTQYQGQMKIITITARLTDEYYERVEAHVKETNAEMAKDNQPCTCTIETWLKDVIQDNLQLDVVSMVIHAE